MAICGGELTTMAIEKIATCAWIDCITCTRYKHLDQLRERGWTVKTSKWAACPKRKGRKDTTSAISFDSYYGGDGEKQ